MKYDADKLAADVNTKRQIKNRLTTREAAAEIGVGHCTVHRAEVRKGMVEVGEGARKEGAAGNRESDHPKHFACDKYAIWLRSVSSEQRRGLG